MINELVKMLSEGNHDVVIGYRNESYEEIKQRIEDGYVYIKFTDTKGGTELGINVDLSNTSIKDSENGKETLHIEGNTNLNYSFVKCIANIDLTKRSGKGYLQVVDNS